MHQKFFLEIIFLCIKVAANHDALLFPQSVHKNRMKVAKKMGVKFQGNVTNLSFIQVEQTKAINISTVVCKITLKINMTERLSWWN